MTRKVMVVCLSEYLHYNDITEGNIYEMLIGIDDEYCVFNNLRKPVYFKGSREDNFRPLSEYREQRINSILYE